MSQRRLIALIALLAVAAVVALVIKFKADPDEPLRRRLPGDVARELSAVDEEELPVHARAYLASDRPWRAARVMRSYAESGVELNDDLRVLAARAEAGWGAWPQVHALLDDMRALDTHDHGIGLYLLGRAQEAAGDAKAAVKSYRAFLGLSPGDRLPAERAAARLRLGLALIAAGQHTEAIAALSAATASAPGAVAWVDLLAADATAARGDTAAVRTLVTRHDSGIMGLHAWRARIRAAQAARDLPAARQLAAQAVKWAQSDGTRSEFMVTEARTALALGDSAAARALLRRVIDIRADGAAAREAAELLQQAPLTPQDYLATARVLRAQGLQAESVAGFRRWLAAGLGSEEEQATVHMEHANALFYSEQYQAVADALRPISGQTDAQFLHARAQSHAKRPKEAVRIYLDLAERFKRTGNGAQALFLAAGIHHDEKQIAQARELYQRVIKEYPATSQMSLAMMRLAGIAFQRKEYAAAAQHWDQYRARFPRGEHALESLYWAGRARQLAGDSAGGAALLRNVLQQQRDSYYALRASQHLGQPFWPLPMSESPPESPGAARLVKGWMAGIDLLRDAGFPDHASAEVDRIVSAAGRDQATLYALGEALAERGYSQRAIRIALQLEKGLTNRRLLRILYPFPYRTLITEEARGRGLDPFIPAALIRQESMFESRITSQVGARGLMQIMPPTGAKLAAAAGIEPFDAELLYHPEINVHLGTRYLTQYMRNYKSSLPSVFSAYNAGAHRVGWWSAFPEYQDEELFTERIPFAETRDYVKILTRNRALYQGLYGGGQKIQ